MPNKPTTMKQVINNNMEENIKSPIQQEDITEEKIKEVLPDAYVIRERIGGCKMCGREEDLRMGWCWDCAEAQNIIAVGQDMFGDDDENAIKFPIKEVNERLKMLLDKGWKKVSRKQSNAQ